MRVSGLAVVLVAAGVGLAGAGLAGRLLGQPEAALGPPAEPSAGLRFQQALAELTMRAAGVSTRGGPVIVTSAELNGFLAHHVEARRLPFRPVLVRAGAARLEIAGRTSLQRLTAGSWLGSAVAYLPVSVRDLGLWVSARGQLVVRPGEAEFVVEGTRVGRQPVPPSWLWRLIDLDPRDQFRWRLPRVVERIDVVPGRLLIHTRQTRRSTG